MVAAATNNYTLIDKLGLDLNSHVLGLVTCGAHKLVKYLIHDQTGQKEATLPTKTYGGFRPLAPTYIWHTFQTPLVRGMAGFTYGSTNETCPTGAYRSDKPE